MPDVKNSRRNWLKYFGYSLFLPFGWLWFKSIDENKPDSKKEELNGNEIPEGISFYDNFIINKKSSKILVFSNKCTHLGCRISSYEDDALVCRCHGSKFDINGKAIKGPAWKSLQKYKNTVENETGKLIIELTTKDSN
ncbi:MAG: cytochrome b6-f complex iron-sulfur subunit [Bacteroidota bacterium]|nr:cytochrome b6-f complex iron-sulfur subunit [Bacteroidota bacterium]